MSEEKLTLADDAAGICADVANRYFMPETRYNHNKLPALVNNISDQVIQQLTQQVKLPRKYICHVTILQKNNAGFVSVSSCAWDAKSDGCYVYKVENKAMYCIITLFGVTL